MNNYNSKSSDQPIRRETIEPPPRERAQTFADSLVDTAILTDITFGDAEIMREIIEIYLEQTARHLTEISRALDKCDAHAIYLAAHKAVGSSATCGMLGVVPMFRELERNGKKGELDRARAVLTATQTAFAAVRRRCLEIAAASFDQD